jgi:hypothetical protein
MLDFLIHNIFIMFGGRVFQQIVCVSMAKITVLLFSPPVLTTDRMHINKLDRGFVEHLADPEIYRFLKGYLCNLGIQ